MGITGILMVIFSVLMKQGNWTFAVLGAENRWNMHEKARLVLGAGCAYLVICVVLAFVQLLDHLRCFKRKSPTRDGDTSPLLRNNRGT